MLDRRSTGIHLIGDVPWGTHFCQFYQDQQDLIDILVPYFKAGLEHNEFCMWVTSEPLRAQEAQGALATEIPNLQDYICRGQIEILDYSQWYTADGGFRSDRVLQGWVGKLDAARQRGFDGLRLTGNTFWLEKSDWKDFTAYEAAVDDVIGRYRMLAICTYSLDKCGAAEVMDVVANHAFALIKRAGQWQVVESAERKRAVAYLRASEERHALDRQRAEERLYARGLIEASLDPLVTISPEGQVTDVNEATELVTGVARDRLIGTSFSDYFTEPRRAEEGYQKVLSAGLVRDYPLTIRHTDGHTTDVLYNAVLYRNEAGQVQGVFAAARDVTERKRLEEELRVASLYARSLLEASLDPLVTISPEGKVTDVNDATELVTGVPRGRLIGTSFSDYFTEPEQAEEGYQRVLSEGLVRDYPLTIRHADGHTTDVLYNAVVYRNEAGQVQGVFAAARDVTERKRAEAELARYRDHLEELVQQRTVELEAANAHLQRTTAELVRSNQELEQFAYVASHDLEEPLRAVTGYLGLIEQLLGDRLDDKGRQYFSGAVQGAARMHTLITDLLALSRVGTRGQAFEPARLDMVLDQALDGLGASIRETGARITRDPLPTLRVDAGQMVQLFQNLVGNALKFRGEEPPEVRVSAREEPGRWVFAVRDNGIGIDPQYFERIFLIFQRLHTRRKYPGTGIGLAICKKIVERHGGVMWLESQPDRGSTFYFTIPKLETL